VSGHCLYSASASASATATTTTTAYHTTSWLDQERFIFVFCLGTHPDINENGISCVAWQVGVVG
jgi:hypothetical protein